MAKGRKTGGRDFGPNNTANLAGRPPLPVEIKKLRTLTHEELRNIGTLLLDGKIEEIKKIATDVEQPALKMWLAKIISSGIERNDLSILNTILDRIVGKVPNQLQLSGNDGGPISIEDTISDEELERRTAALLKILKA